MCWSSPHVRAGPARAANHGFGSLVVGVGTVTVVGLVVGGLVVTGAGADVGGVVPLVAGGVVPYV